MTTALQGAEPDVLSDDGEVLSHLEHPTGAAPSRSPVGISDRTVEEMIRSDPGIPTRIDREGPLVAALRRGDPTAGEDLVAAYGDRACRLAKRITKNAQDAEETVQDALLSAIRKIETFRGDSTFGSWLYRIVVNAACQRCRRSGMHAGTGRDCQRVELTPVQGTGVLRLATPLARGVRQRDRAGGSSSQPRGHLHIAPRSPRDSRPDA